MRRSVHPVAYGIKRAQNLDDAAAAVSRVIDIPIELSVYPEMHATLRRSQAGFEVRLPATMTWVAQATLLGMALGHIIYDRSHIDNGTVEEVLFPRTPALASEQSRRERFAEQFVETLLNMTPVPLKGLFG